MYAITWCVDLPSKIGDLEILILLTSCICHDLDHPGYNNIYQINAKTELAIRYNDISPLENHHCSVAFRILENEDCNIFKSFSSEAFKQVREGMIRCILATDMARHNEILQNFKEITPEFDFTDKAHVNLVSILKHFKIQVFLIRNYYFFFADFTIYQLLRFLFPYKWDYFFTFFSNFVVALKNFFLYPSFLMLFYLYFILSFILFCINLYRLHKNVNMWKINKSINTF